MAECMRCKRESPLHREICPYCGHNKNDFVVGVGYVPAIDPASPLPVEYDRSKVSAAEDTWDIPPPRERRDVCVLVPEEYVLSMLWLSTGKLPEYFSVPDFPELPAGYTVRGVWHEHLNRCFIFIVEHPSFEAVPDGAPAPLWPKPLTATWRAVKVAKDE